MNDYTPEQLHEYFLQSPSEVQEILLSDDLETTATVLGKLYKLPIDKFVILKNIITLVLLGLMKPEKVVEEIEKNISVEKSISVSIAKDLNDSILQKTRIKLFGEDEDTVKILQIKDSSPTPDILREEIMSKTSANSAINNTPTEVLTMPTKEKVPLFSKIGSHNQLLEQLEILGNVPHDDEVEARLSKIRTQVENIQKNTASEKEVAEEKEKEEAESVEVATKPHKPIFPDHYNIDPYREISETVSS